MLRNVIRNIIYTTVLPVVTLFVGLIVSFLLSRLLPGDPVLAYLPPSFSPAQYNLMVQILGFDKPIIAQFFRYLAELISGDFGISGSINKGQPITLLILPRILNTIEFTIFPIVLGLVAGILLGMLSVRVRYKLIKLVFQILIILGISMPLFFIGMWFQYTLAFQLGLFPAVGDPFLPSTIIFLLTLSLTLRQVRSNYLKKSEEKHILSNSLHIFFNFGIIITSIILLEVIFNLNGFFSLAFFALQDYWIYRAFVYILIMLSSIILFLSSGVYLLYNYFSGERQSKIFAKIFGRTEQMVEEGARYSVSSKQKFKHYAINRLLSPLAIIGLVIVIFFIILAIFPQILTPLTIQETLGVYIGSWNSPSPTHPLGQAKFGRDVLALLAYGISTSILVCIVSVIIGMVIGAQFGYLAKVHRYIKGMVLGFMVILFVIPSIFMILTFVGILGRSVIITMSIMTMFTIPGATLLFSRGNYSLAASVKKLVAYFPLFMAFNILLFEAVAFLGYGDYTIIQLGDNINQARMHLYDAPWASLPSGLALYAIVIGFITLHYGLKEPIPIPLPITKRL